MGITLRGAIGFALVLWALADLYRGKADYRYGSVRFTEDDDGWVFKAVVILKVLAGLQMMWFV